MFEILLVILAVVWLVVLPVTGLGLAIWGLVRTGRIRTLEARVATLESRSRPREPEAARVERVPAAEPAAVSEGVVAAAEVVELPPPRVAAHQPFRWEEAIGQKGFGWVAVVLGIFAAAFFLKYAYDNNWVGPLGRVAVGEVAGCALMLAGWRHFRRDWRLFSQMLSACGVVVLYLSTYSSFGLYHLLTNFEAGAFLAGVVGLSMIVAVLYDSLALSLVATLGGLATPILLSSEQDMYVALFTYLTALNLGICLVVRLRSWPALGTVSLVGTQGLYWMWHAANYHPEKLAWAIGFQAVLYVLYFVLDLAVQSMRGAVRHGETAFRMLLNAVFWFAAVYVLLAYDYRPWMGSAALAMAAIYLLLARVLLAAGRRSEVELLMAISLSLGFIVLAIPLEADARWVALGWAACAGALLWFGVRVEAVPLRCLAGALACICVMRLLAADLTAYPDELLPPIVNRIALPCLGVVACLMSSLMAARSLRGRFSVREGSFLAAAGLGVVVLLWLVLSVDLYHHLSFRARLAESTTPDWRRLAQMSLSVLWTLYATVLLAIGFRWRVAALRWLAIAFYGLTVGKVFLFDMAGLAEIYRIVAFIVLAVFLGIAARVYHQLGRRNGSGIAEEVISHGGN